MYIRKVEIKNFWGNHSSWTLNQDVNLLIGKIKMVQGDQQYYKC
jgi:predicted ATP-dependent endonuclease of OLD family